MDFITLQSAKKFVNRTICGELILPPQIVVKIVKIFIILKKVTERKIVES